VSVNTSSAPDWGNIRLVVFDVDGTLYDQRGLRLCMLREMLLESWKLVAPAKLVAAQERGPARAAKKGSR